MHEIHAHVETDPGLAHMPCPVAKKGMTQLGPADDAPIALQNLIALKLVQIARKVRIQIEPVLVGVGEGRGRAAFVGVVPLEAQTGALAAATAERVEGAETVDLEP